MEQRTTPSTKKANLFARVWQWFVRDDRGPRVVRRWWLRLRPAIMMLTSLLLVVVVLYLAAAMVFSRYVTPPDANDKTMHDFRIERGMSVTAITKKLEKEGFIRSATMFKYYLDFTDRNNLLKAGFFQLSYCMTWDQIIDTLSYTKIARTETLMLREGLTVQQMADLFVEKEVLPSVPEMMALAADPTALAANYDFLQEVLALPNLDQRSNLLEGYLFPDTYDFFTNISPTEAAKKMLTAFNSVFTDEYRARAAEMGLTIDQVVILASILEKEGGREVDMPRVSAVLHNRMGIDMRLQCNATIAYALGIKRLVLTAEERNYPSPYNSYLNDGLPPGPICNPSKRAIHSVLYPDQEYLADENGGGGYLYFCTGDPSKNEVVFAKTLAQHQQNVDTYGPMWAAADQESGN